MHNVHDMTEINILIFGDVVGKIGRLALKKHLPVLRDRYSPDITAINVENLAHGRGITAGTLQEMSDLGIDIFTSGHHVWENPQGLPLLDSPDWQTKLIRPLNADPKLAGVGYCVKNIKAANVIFLNLQGRLFMSQEVSSPFLAFDRFWTQIVPQYPNPVVVIDFHAEATSEKQALGHFADGRAGLIYGTHTHVPTADAQVLENGTGYITDVGMVGAHDSVIGFEKNSSIKRYLEDSTAPYEIPSQGRAVINALLWTMTIDKKGENQLKLISEIVDI